MLLIKGYVSKTVIHHRHHRVSRRKDMTVRAPLCPYLCYVERGQRISHIPLEKIVPYQVQST